MNRFSWAILFLLISWRCPAQIVEPPRDHFTKEDYMVMLIDSLGLAQKDRDTVNIIRFSAILTNEFQTAMMLERASSYLHTALHYSRVYSDPVWFADVCNRAGMFMPAFCDSPGIMPCRQAIDSSRYWYHQAIARGLALRQYKTAGWGYRGLLVNAVRYEAGYRSADSVLFYYQHATDIAKRIDDQELMINCRTQYGNFLYNQHDWQQLEALLRTQSGYFNQMTPTQKAVFSVLQHDYLAQVNHLDTLIILRKINEDYVYNRAASRHKEELYAKDQQYEVSKTKAILDQTSDQLNTTNRVLIVSVIIAGVFALLLAYLFHLFRKNKKLSVHNEFLLKEQNHRVKNNFQMISSLLSLQARKLSSADAKEALEKNQSRINSVALLHRMLYESDSLVNVKASAYFRSLVEELQYTVGRHMQVTLDISDTLELKVEKLTSLGLILHELLINSVKHVHPEVSLQARLQLSVNEGALHLVYTDNGQGLSPEGWKSSGSFGSQLIELQSRQLGGKFEVGSAGGFRYALRFYAGR